ncbi:hypothetical protein KAK05_04025, partial [Candidatus Parcubacteria bacterium]|nr:hypothetical protein [Candidatus Parcubacteria bacterium]
IGISDWTIELYQNLLEDPIATAITIAEDLGSYEFKNLIPGTYFIKEASRIGWSQTSPTNPSHYEITISEDNPISENNNFGNYYQNSEIKASISGCKYDDKNNNGTADEGEEKLSDWNIQLIRCPYTPLSSGELQFLDLDPGSSGAGSCTVERSTVTGGDGCYSFADLETGDYGIREITQENWTQTFPLNNNSYYFNLMDGEIKTGIDFLNYEELAPIYQCSDNLDNDGDGYIDYPNDPGCDSSEDDDEYNTYCGDGICNGNENCSNCSQDCGSCGGGGGTVITKPIIIITNEKVVYLGDGKAEVTWTTNIETTEQVAYGDNSVSTLGDLPTYGYDLVNDESNFMKIEHSMIITSLTDGISYYFRPIAD